MVQKIKYLIIGLIVGFLISTSVVFANTPIKILLNGSQIQGAEAVNIGGRVFVPVRVITEALNLDVEWDETTQTVKLNNKSLINKSNEKQQKTTGNLKVNDDKELRIGDSFIEGGFSLKLKKVELKSKTPWEEYKRVDLSLPSDIFGVAEFEYRNESNEAVSQYRSVNILYDDPHFQDGGLLRTREYNDVLYSYVPHSSGIMFIPIIKKNNGNLKKPIYITLSGTKTKWKIADN